MGISKDRLHRVLHHLSVLEAVSVDDVVPIGVDQGQRVVLDIVVKIQALWVAEVRVRNTDRRPSPAS